MNRPPTPTSTSFSTACAVTVRPDRNTRNLVLLSCCLLGALAAIAPLFSALAAVIKGLVALAAVGWTALALYRQLVAYGRIGDLCFYADGRVSVAGQVNAPAMRVLPGSLLTGRMLWLRLATDDGGSYGELITAGSLTANDWRRLRVIWFYAPRAA